MTDLPVAINRYLDSYENLLKKFPSDGLKQTSRYFEVDCRQIHALNKLRLKKHENVLTARDEKHIKKILLTSLDLADTKVDITKHLMGMVEDNILKLKTYQKDIEMARAVEPTSNKSPKPKRMLKWTPNYMETDSDSVELNVDDCIRHLDGNETEFKKNVQIISDLDNNIQAPETVFTVINQNIKNTNMNENPRTKSPEISNQVLAESSNCDINKEPTYCICEEISYGNMVYCDNDLCPIQWFHFGCVSIKNKPRGKWYCPRCRGANSKTMKSREILLKELEEYNKRKEEGC